MPASPTTPPTLVCFDIGGVLVSHFRSWAPACQAMGLPVPDNVDDPAFVATRRQLHRLFSTGEIDENTFCQGLAEASQGMYAPDDIRRLHDGWIQDEYPGVRELLGELRQHRRARVAALSNTNAAHWRQLLEEPDSPSRFGSLFHIEHRHASHLLRASKPDPVIYERFEQTVGVFGPDILFFDDLAENIAAAHSRGWRTTQIDHTQPTAPQIRASLSAHALLPA